MRLLLQCRIGRHDHARVDQRPTVPVFGQRGQLVYSIDIDPAPLKRLQQRIGEPLRKLVERHPARGSPLSARERVLPHISERLTGKLPVRRPNRRQCFEQRGKDFFRAERMSAALFRQGIEQMSGPRRDPEKRGLSA